ncbi:MAG: lamin tail domain-containing protein, partial [Planctomycetes bacterium]|nr:lamin tail domain-containing protein [Planctomycetota bacterium]
MCRSVVVSFLSLAVTVSLSGFAGAAYLEGDLSGDCRVGFEDVLSLADQWLAPAGSPADIVGDDGVDMIDFATLAENWGQRRCPIIINEIHYDPDVKTELVEYIELHNISVLDVNIGGWYFSAGISYVFPADTILPAGGYVVVAQTPAQVQDKFAVASSRLFGPWIGKLSNDGERVVLRDSDGKTVDEVDYGLGFPWPTVGGPPGYSIELVNPGLDNDLGGSWRPSEPESVPPPTTLIARKAKWKYLKGKAEASLPMSAWRQIDFEDAAWSEGNLIIGYGESGGFITTELSDMRYNYSSVYLRKKFEVDDPDAFGSLTLELIYDDGFNAYINGVHVKRPDNVSADELPYYGTANNAREDLGWNTFILPSPSGYLVKETNVLAIHLYNSSKDSSSDCFLDVRLEGSPASFGPSPGRKNTAYADNTPPHMRQVKHSPEHPKSGEDVKITVKVTDSDGVQYVMLYYQLVDPGSYIELDDLQYQTNWILAAMTDDGTGGDQQADDHIYTVVLDGSKQTHRRLVRYRIKAWDYTGLSLTGPYRYDYEKKEPVPNFAYFVYDSVPDWYGAARPGYTPVVHYTTEVLTSVPVYHLITKKQSVADAMYMPGNLTGQYWTDQYPWYGTLIYDGKVYDHIRYRARGGCWRYSMGKNMWKFDFNRSDHFQARDDYGRKYDTKWDKLNFSACIQQGNYWHRGEQGMFEAAGFKLFNLVGTESPKTNWVHFRVIDEAAEAGPTQYDGDFWGLYMNLEQMDGRFLDEHGLSDGNLYKMEGGFGELNNQGPTAVTDKSDLNKFINGYNSYPAADWWLSNVEVDKYFGYRTIVDGIHHYDIGSNKNYFYYLNPVANASGHYLWSQLPWDLDLAWNDDMYDCGNRGNSPFKRYGLWDNSSLRIRRNNRIREIRDLLFNTDQGWQLIDDLAAIIDDPAGGPSIVDADRAMWDYNPIMVSSYVNSSKAGQGRFYQKAATKDFPGMVQIMKGYVVQRSTVGDPRTGAEPGLDPMAYDAAIPYTPTVSYSGPAGYPINALLFRTSAFGDPQGSGTFGAMKWRIAEVTDKSNPRYRPDDPRKYEIETIWQSEELTPFQYDIQIPASAVKVGHTYRVRCKMQDTSGRWSHWSEPNQFVAGEAISANILDDLRITEVMYNPADADTSKDELNIDNDEFEYVELKNTGD